MALDITVLCNAQEVAKMLDKITLLVCANVDGSENYLSVLMSYLLSHVHSRKMMKTFFGSDYHADQEARMKTVSFLIG